jgi:hypothetical protein
LTANEIDLITCRGAYCIYPLPSLNAILDRQRCAGIKTSKGLPREANLVVFGTEQINGKLFEHCGYYCIG